MNTNKLVSIIIPVYNAEKYIFKCLKSVLNQTYTNIEVIIIDDQSTDKSLEICTKLQKEDSRIKIYMQSHSGVVVARKKGIINSSGEYICFVDADDFVKNTLIENLLNEMRKCDIVCAGVLKEDKYGNTIAKTNDILKGVYNDEKQLKYIEDNMIYVNNVKNSRDFFAGIRDIVGGRSGAYEKELRKAREIAFKELGEQAKALGADAVVGIDIDYETVGKDGSMLMVSVSGTAVKTLR